MMDSARYVCDWLDNGDKLADYDDEKTRKQKGFLSHMEALRNLFYQTNSDKYGNLGRKPDDLADVLADMAIASPAIYDAAIQETLDSGASQMIEEFRAAYQAGNFRGTFPGNF